MGGDEVHYADCHRGCARIYRGPGGRDMAQLLGVFPMTNVFPYTVALLQLAAAVEAGLRRQWALSISWLCYAVASSALGTLQS